MKTRFSTSGVIFTPLLVLLLTFLLLVIRDSTLCEASSLASSSSSSTSTSETIHEQSRSLRLRGIRKNRFSQSSEDDVADADAATALRGGGNGDAGGSTETEEEQEEEEEKESIRCLLVLTHVEHIKSTGVITTHDTSVHGIGTPSSHNEWKCQVIPTSSTNNNNNNNNNNNDHGGYGRLFLVKGLESWVENFVLKKESEEQRRSMREREFVKFVRKGYGGGYGSAADDDTNSTTSSTGGDDCMSKVGIESGETELVVSIRRPRTTPGFVAETTTAQQQQVHQWYNSTSSSGRRPMLLHGGTLDLGSVIVKGGSADVEGGGANNNNNDDDDTVDLVDRFSKASLLKNYRPWQQRQQRPLENNNNDGPHGDDRRRRRLLNTSKVGVRNLLVVRASIGQDSSTTLSKAIFGTAGPNGAPPNPTVDGDWNLRGAINACSYGQLDMKPAVWPLTPPKPGETVIGSNLIQNGVITVDIGPVVPANRMDAMTAMWYGAEALLGLGPSYGKPFLENTFDNVMFCLPPGTADGWIAEGWVNNPFSLYNGDWCKYPSAMMHEIGHNLNMDHAKDITGEYGDMTGVMGASSGDDNGPKMCYNVPNSFHLGWYKHQQLDWDPLTQGSLSTKMVGVVDYDPDNADPFRNVIVRLGPPNDDAGYFIGYNRAAGFNSGTMEGANQVTIHRYRGLRDNLARKSNLLKLLSVGEQYTIPSYSNNGVTFGDLIVRWTSTTNNVPLVDVYMAS